MSTMEEVTAKMTAFARRQPLRLLADSLEQIDAKPKLDQAERLARAVLIDVICERCPAADAAFDAWAESDDTGPGRASAVIVTAVRATTP
jgi:hypothetical protein